MSWLALISSLTFSVNLTVLNPSQCGEGVEPNMGDGIGELASDSSGTGTLMGNKGRRPRRDDKAFLARGVRKLSFGRPSRPNRAMWDPELAFSKEIDVPQGVQQGC
jgi:hypothetical protein